MNTFQISSKVVLVLCLAGGLGVMAEDATPPAPPKAAGGEGAGNRTPEQNRQRAQERIKEQLAVTEDQWKTLQPKIEAVQKAQAETRTGGAPRRRNNGGENANGPAANTATPAAAPATTPAAAPATNATTPATAPAPANANRPEPTALEKKAQELRTLLENKEADPKTVSDQLKEFREMRDNARTSLKKAQNELREVLTPKQEAQLVLSGLVE